MARQTQFELEGELEQELEEEYAESPELQPEGALELEQEGKLETAGPGEAEVIGPDSRVRVTNTTAAPFRYICNLDYDFPGSGSWAMCTGTLIGHSTVLTAGHCLSGLVPSRMRVIPGRNGTLEPLPATQALSFHLAPGFAPGTTTDYGVIHLRDPIGNRVGYWSVAHRRWPWDSTGTSISADPLPLQAGVLRVNISGYPADKPSASRYGCIDPTQPRNRCRHSLIGNPRRQRVCGTQQWRAYDRTVSSSGGILEYLDDTCPGHSGSPVWVRRDPSKGGRVLIAIHVTGDFPPAPVANRGVRITRPILANIRRWLAAAPVRPRGPIILPPLVIEVRPFRVLDRFEFDKATLRPFHIPVIQLIARHVVASWRTRQPIRTVRLVGHTDSRGPAQYNQTLGQRRALAVQSAIRSAIDPLSSGLAARISFVPQSLGETRPVAPSSTVAGRARNRRVAVFLSRV